ncbi:MAG: hypothetical protein WC192_01555 [Candidatus Babeliales bacterium]|jgi:hypothetical protein
MKNFFKKSAKKVIQRIFDIEYNNDTYNKKCNLYKNEILSQVEQRRLFIYYQQLVSEKKYLPSIKDVGFRVFSQTDEDGILLYIFALIGTTNKLCLDLAFISPFESNTANLLCNWGWTGILICADQEEIAAINYFFEKHPDTYINPPQVVKKFITSENINSTLKENKLSGEIDLFSLDIDGVDYWIWKSLEIVQPRVIIVEFNNIWGKLRAVTVPYSPDFARFKIAEDFYGASLPAFIKLASEKGYRLVGCNKNLFNAFFVKNGIADDILPTLSIDDCFAMYIQARSYQDKLYSRLQKVKDLNWQDV